MRKLFSQEKGITLLSLIVTVIVLLILAGVSINTMRGYDSIPDNANEAVNRTQVDEKREQNMINKLDALFKQYLSDD